ncbi:MULTISPECIES: hypothetical protein [unclassified Nocardioides]|uniref:hypothetical protein n=1 Tax=unclassified Nocardioides TaxID=2615069 RepID=UPI0006FD632E|nr:MULTISPECIES: hypothetical protein [unclassified Nocardioides]KQY63930.1 hypothetical protein ASD30_02820 [Nocardioides sp. Root140]KRF15944.1 hypothetical protein ASH02_04825 [Nocardioides sp. Soil796]
MERDEDALWREIVDNYDTAPDDGELPEAERRLQTEDVAEAPESGPPSDTVEPEPQLFAVPLPVPEPEEPLELRSWNDEGRYVPPPPERIPLPEPPRLLGWLGVFLAPVIALVALVLGHPFRGLLALLLVGWFVGGFLYLVHTMPDDPRDPWDDGSRV